VSESVMSSMNYQPIVDRAIGVLTLKDPVYEEIEHDQSATTQAAIVVGVAALAGAIGGIRDGFGGIIVGLVFAFLGWALASAIIYFVGTKITDSPATEADLGQVLRLVGYASVIYVVDILRIFGSAGWWIASIISLYAIVLFIKAIMHALEMSLPRALATAAIAWGGVLVLAIIGAAIA
jgi:hypothetical protein